MKKILSVLLVIVVLILPGCGKKDVNVIGEEKAKSIALADAGLDADSVTFRKASLEFDDGIKLYDIEFYSADNVEYEYEINAETGEIIAYDREKDKHMFD